MNRRRNQVFSGSKLLIGTLLVGIAACNTIPAEPTSSQAENATQLASSNQRTCSLVNDGYGSPGKVDIRVEEIATGLEVPWGIAFLPNGDMLVTERAGRVRLLRNGKLLPKPVANINVTESGEGGLLGIAAHPNFGQNRLFYVYYTGDRGRYQINRVERWQLSTDGQSATRDRTIIDDIPVALYHNGGRLRFGPDGMLYIGTGDARNPDSSQDMNSLAGKILRLTPDGQIPQDNPTPGNPVFISGIRNTQGFDWLNESTLAVTDHGPSGELGRSGEDKVFVASSGDNLSWPTIQTCEPREGLVSPSLVWRKAVPPGGAIIYRGNAIPEWQGSLIIATLGSEHLHRVVFDPKLPNRVQLHEVYLQGESQNSYGRLREAIMGADGELYVTTSNCDGRGSCPPQQDKILRITR